MIKGVRNIRKYVAPSKSIPLPIAVKDGSINIGTVFLIPYLNVEYTIKKLTILPTSNCGFPIINGTNTESEYIE